VPGWRLDRMAQMPFNLPALADGVRRAAGAAGRTRCAEKISRHS
jgi:hypothetical protein